MELKSLFTDKTIKPKDRTTRLAEMILTKQLPIDDLIVFVKSAKDPVKATCIEALEYATKTNPEIITGAAIDLVIACLSEKAPRIKWESARVIGNVIHRLPDKIEDAVKSLLNNTENTGTVVRWSAAYALGQIVKLKTGINDILVPAIKNIIENEEKNSIKKIYLGALKHIKK
jgi:HEAT repeat protein